MTSRRQGTKPPAAAPDDDQVAAYLRAHPDFLVRHPDLAAILAPPPRTGDGIADLQRFQIDRLRQDLDTMRGCAEHLISTTRSNMSTQTRTHDAVLAVLDAPSLADLALAVIDELPGLLDVDAITLCFETGRTAVRELAVPGVRRLPEGAVDRVLGEPGRETLLCAGAPGDAGVFDVAAGLVRSFALVRLHACGRCPPGLLALGSRDERAFQPGQGVDLLSFLARVIEHGVRRWVG